ncbi:MAG TPA: 16S rRNA (adenine(1518)-N(6)/adenine(1519)-N(6))-dimethyltransferase [Lachnospiraceae bacterium]|nr:16S rRNA (adenine(1518)-N(6)/adenine(1519)-N(6))-dimethyltransferase [Lachnospiraceae bacterium]
MADISSPGGTRSIIERYGFSARKKYGQNFLVDGNILKLIVASADVSDRDTVIEIGPGIGTMTKELAERALRVLAVEIDRELIPILHETLDGFENVDIINEDILKLELSGCLNRYLHDNTENGDRHIKVVANLPYYITTPVIMKLLEGDVPLESITVMVQKEVAERMCVGPGTKEYGALSLAVQYYSRPVIIAEVPPSCFFPRPKVSSSVIRLDILKDRSVQVEDEELLFKLIRASFNQRRKTLANAVRNFAGLSLSKEQVQAALIKAGFDPEIRGEALSLSDFAEFTNILKSVFFT